MSNIDNAEKNLKSVLNQVRSDISSIETEEDAKVKIINRIFNECLGWSFTQFSLEKQHDSGYSDYVMKVGEHPSVIVEAKRIGILGIESAIQDRHRTLKISGTSLKQSIDGIQQAFAYASEAGIPIAVVTDGLRWIVFKTWVQGGSYKDKEAFVFPSLESVENSFSVFYELLAYEHFTSKTYNLLFDGIHNSRQTLSFPLKAPLEADEIRLLQKSPIAYDLEKIFNGFFTHLIGDNNAEMMAECFVESNESRIADYSLEKITTSILSNMSPDNSMVGSELSELIEGNVQAELPSDSDMSVFIVGPTGSGKTTYIGRFFSKILPAATRKDCLLASINCLDASGDDGTSIRWITESIISALEQNLFEDGYPDYSHLQGMYFGHYKRMSAGYLKKIYENNRAEFDRQFSDFLKAEVRDNREGYLDSLLMFTIRNRKKLPIIILDNTDEFTLEFKIKIYQLCNAYRRKAKNCMLIFPVTDKSAWSFSKTDIFTIHQSRSFFLPTPSPREVFRKRIDFLGAKLVSAEESEKKAYLTKNGIRIEFKDINKFAQVLEEVFVENNFTAKTLGELTNYNIRAIMSLSKRIITSPVMRIEDLVTSYLTTEPISYKKFIDALIRGDYEAYKSSTGDDFGIISTFKVNSEKIHSPLLLLRILAILRVTRISGRDVDERHLTVHSLVQYFEAIGVDIIDLQRCLTEMVFLRLVEPYDPSASMLSDSQKLAITYKGIAHYDLSTRSKTYFYQMALTTGMTDPEVVNFIKTRYQLNHSFSENAQFIRKRFSEYLIAEDSKFVASDQGKDQFECQREILREIKSFGLDKGEAMSDAIVRFYGAKLIGEVTKYDTEKDYGFIFIKEIDQDVYFNLKALGTTLDPSMGGAIFDHDIVYCTLGPGPKGPVIKSIEGFVDSVNAISKDRCVIKTYFPSKGYGFVYVGASSNEAFFYKTAFPASFFEHLRPGLEFEAEIRLKSDGKFQVRRCINLIK